MPRIVLSNYYSAELLREIEKVVPKGFEIIPLKEPTQENLKENMPLADYLLVGGRIKVDKSILDQATHLKMVQRTGVGLDSLDLKELKHRDIPLYVNPGINARSVAEHTLMLILSVLRNVVNIDETLKKKKWKKHEFGIQNHELSGKAVGLIGLGNIGLSVAKMLQPFGVRILYTKRTRLEPSFEEELNLKFVSLTHLLKVSDIISLHCSLNKSTIRILNDASFKLMKKGVVIINTSRGKLIDERVLIHYLKNGKVKGAGLDVYEKEPFSRNNELLSLANVILSPHISGITQQSFQRMMTNAFYNIDQFEKGDKNTIHSNLITYE